MHSVVIATSFYVHLIPYISITARMQYCLSVKEDGAWQLKKVTTPSRVSCMNFRTTFVDVTARSLQVKDGQVQPENYKLVPVQSLDELPRHFVYLADHEKNSKSADKNLSGLPLWQLAFLGSETSEALLYSEGESACLIAVPNMEKRTTFVKGPP